MKIVFNDITELQIQTFSEENGKLQVKTVSSTRAELKKKFDDTFATKKLVIKEREQTVAVYEDYTEMYSMEEYAGGILGVTMYQVKKTPEVQAEVQAAAVLVAQMQAQNLTDEQALEVQAIYPAWNGKGISYAAGFKVLFAGVLYKCLQDHVSQLDWMPDAAPSLWAKVLIAEDGSVPEWQQPDSTNAYMLGDKVVHNGTTYESLVDNNVWEPGTPGTENLWKVAETE